MHVRQTFTVSHEKHCPKGYPHMRHNEISDEMSDLMDEVCYDVSIEPNLQPVQNERFANKSTTREHEARLKVNVLQKTGVARTFSDVRIFNPHANSFPNASQKHSSTTRHQKANCEERVVKVEKSTFCPLIFSCNGGLGPSALEARRRQASLISDERNEPYTDVYSYFGTN